MKKSMLIVLSLAFLLAACSSGATPTAGPAVTQAPPTMAPQVTEASTATESPVVTEAPAVTEAASGGAVTFKLVPGELCSSMRWVRCS